MLSDFKTYCKATVVKSVALASGLWICGMEQSPEVNLQEVTMTLRGGWSLGRRAQPHATYTSQLRVDQGLNLRLKPLNCKKIQGKLNAVGSAVIPV